MGLAEGDLNTVTVSVCLPVFCLSCTLCTYVMAMLWGDAHGDTYPSISIFHSLIVQGHGSQHSTSPVSQVTSLQLCELLYCGTLHIISWLTSMCGTLWHAVVQTRFHVSVSTSTSLSTSVSRGHEFEYESESEPQTPTRRRSFFCDVDDDSRLTVSRLPQLCTEG